MLHDFHLQISASYKTHSILQHKSKVLFVKIGLVYAFNSSAECVGFVVDKVTLVLFFPRISVFRGQFHSTTAQHRYLLIYFVEGNSNFDE